MSTGKVDAGTQKVGRRKAKPLAPERQATNKPETTYDIFLWGMRECDRARNCPESLRALRGEITKRLQAWEEAQKQSVERPEKTRSHLRLVWSRPESASTCVGAD